jgi:hypothetical protein
MSKSWLIKIAIGAVCAAFVVYYLLTLPVSAIVIAIETGNDLDSVAIHVGGDVVEAGPLPAGQIVRRRVYTRTGTGIRVRAYHRQVLTH